MGFGLDGLDLLEGLLCPAGGGGSHTGGKFNTKNLQNKVKFPEKVNDI
jgi:hypothetical protein